MHGAEGPVGVFDSGSGGISLLGEMTARMPHERFVYYGDHGNAPYGSKSREEVLALVWRVIERLLQEKAKAIVIACNTATAAAAEELRRELKLPVIGIEPALKPASLTRRSGRILVLATPLTLALEKFARLMDRYGEYADKAPCPGLVELIEREDWHGAEEYVKEIIRKRPEAPGAVVLGCTHYVFLRDAVQRIVGPGVPVLDGNEGTACQLQRVLRERGLECTRGEGGVQLETGGDEAAMLPQMRRLLVIAEKMAKARL